jgi:hypothetical protein
MPIFPRRVPTRPGNKVLAVQKGGNNIKATATTKLDSVADLPAFIGAEPTNAFDTEDEKALGPGGEQLYEENMVIVDGWRMYLFFLSFLSGWRYIFLCDHFLK